MKKLLKNNQVIITALAVLIAIAGYLNYAQKIGAENDYQAVLGNDITNEKQDLFDISEEDILAENQALLESISGEQSVLSGNEEDIESLDVDLEPIGSDIPGDAVFTGGGMTVSSITEVKLKREQSKSLQKASLMEIINSTSVTEVQKQEAIDRLLDVSKAAEREAAAEMLLEAKGFSDVVVSINNDSVDVVVNAGQLSDADRAQIEDIVKRKTEIAASKIVITPFAG